MRASLVALLLVATPELALAQPPEVGLGTLFAQRDPATGKVEEMAGEKFFCLNRAVDSKTPGIAHRTLPCGTTVLLVNVRNGRTARAKVIDRGPYWNVPAACAKSVHGQFPGHPCWAKGRGRVRMRPGYVRASIVDITPPVARQLGLRGKEPVLLYVVPRGRYLW